MMIYFCADDYGVSKESNLRIENCLEHGVLNKVSVLPNAEQTDFKNRLSSYQATVGLHINLVEGYPLSNPKDINLLVSEDGSFRHSFVGLLFGSLSRKRKDLEKQLYLEIQSQIRFWKQQMGDGVPVFLDSHQHTHMIPLVLKTLMQVIDDENLPVAYLRIPAEPLRPYLLAPSLYFSYSVSGLAKQWLLKLLAFKNRKILGKRNFPSAYFMGVLFSGHLTEARIKKVLPRYLKLAKQKGKPIEIGFHPGYIENGEKLIPGNKKGFQKFYFSPWRKKEYETLLTMKR